jgi:hypothetical protein
VVAEQRAEIARLKGLKGPPSIKPPIKPSGTGYASAGIAAASGVNRLGRRSARLTRIEGVADTRTG